MVCRWFRLAIEYLGPPGERFCAHFFLLADFCQQNLPALVAGDGLMLSIFRKIFIFWISYIKIIGIMSPQQDVSILIAFTAGFLSFVSPCVLPLVPSYITYITGISFKELTEEKSRANIRWATILHSFLFITGFSTVFILMGASASYLGQILVEYQSWIMRGGGLLIIFLGIHFTGMINIPFLQMERRFEMRKKPLGYLGSFLVGIVFAAGWTPCIGPILSTILIYASTSQNFTTGILLLAAYSVGLGIPFFLSSLAFNSFLSTFDRMKRYLRWITLISGLFLIAIGVLMLTDTFRKINTFLNQLANP